MQIRVTDGVFEISWSAFCIARDKFAVKQTDHTGEYIMEFDNYHDAAQWAIYQATYMVGHMDFKFTPEWVDTRMLVE